MSTYARVAALLEIRRWSDAAQELSRVLADDPYDARAWRLLALARRGEGDVEGALAAARTAVETAPDDSDAQRVLALVSSFAGQHDDAVDAARRAVTMDPNEPMSHVRLVDALVQRAAARGRPLTAVDVAEARRAGDAALRLAPHHPGVHDARAALAQASGDLASADAHYATALSLDPHRVGATSSLAVVRSHRGRLGSAGKLFGAALRERPTSGGVEALAHLGHAVLRRTLGMSVLAALVALLAVSSGVVDGGPVLVLSAVAPAYFAYARFAIPPALRSHALGAVPRRVQLPTTALTTALVAVTMSLAVVASYVPRLVVVGLALASVPLLRGTGRPARSQRARGGRRRARS